MGWSEGGEREKEVICAVSACPERRRAGKKGEGRGRAVSCAVSECAGRRASRLLKKAEFPEGCDL